MAVFNEILVGRFNRALQKLVGIKGPVPAPQVASEFMPIFPFPLGTEFRYLDGWNKFGVNILAVGGAATFGSFLIRNPTKSGAIAVIEKLVVQRNQVETLNVYMGTVAADLAGPVTVVRLDARVGAPNTASGAMKVSVTAAVAASAPAGTGTIDLLQGNATFSLMSVVNTDSQEIPLLPGDGLLVVDQTVNVTFGVTCWWRERALEDSEVQ